jgi:hypothetical protein
MRLPERVLWFVVATIIYSVAGLLSGGCIVVMLVLFLPLWLLGFHVDARGFSDKPAIREANGLFGLILTNAAALTVALHNAKPLELWQWTSAPAWYLGAFTAVSIVTVLGLMFMLHGVEPPKEKPGELGVPGLGKHAYDWASIMLTRWYTIAGVGLATLTIFLAIRQQLPGQPFSKEINVPIKTAAPYSYKKKEEKKEGIAASGVIVPKMFKGNEVPRQANLKVVLPKEMHDWDTKNVYVFVDDKQLEDIPVRVQDDPEEKNPRASIWLLDGLKQDKEQTIKIYVFPKKEAEIPRFIERLKEGVHVSVWVTEN